MERLLIDFSQVYGKNGTHEVTRSIYNTHASPLKANKNEDELPKTSFEDLLTESIN